MRSTARPDSVAISDCAVVNFSCHFSVAVWCSVATACAAASRAAALICCFASAIRRATCSPIAAKHQSYWLAAAECAAYPYRLREAEAPVQPKASRLLISQPIFPATTKQCPHPLPHGPLRPLSKQNCPNPPVEIRCPTHFLGAPTPVPLETVAAPFAAAESMPLVHALAAAAVPAPRGEFPASPTYFSGRNASIGTDSRGN